MVEEDLAEVARRYGGTSAFRMGNRTVVFNAGRLGNTRGIEELTEISSQPQAQPAASKVPPAQQVGHPP
ncbi:MAG TPA: hypothetical protein VEW42_00080, partial [Candidatus Eisenbacteria bacterium]|nr:hypothetical protein [Candidatus Eisenbacteria bacterium]